jgi:HlyD family secretion protein
MRKYWWWFLVLPLVVLLWFVFSRGDSAVTLHFTAAHRGSVSSSVPTNGRVEPAEWSAATCETSGVVKSVNVHLGQNVKAGETLVALDTTSAYSDLTAALARLESEKASLKILSQGGRAATVADLDDRLRGAQEAVSIAERIYASDQRLLEKQAVTKLQLDTDRDTLTRARINVEALQNQKKSIVTSSDKSVAQARVRDAQAAVDLARHRVDLAIIKAPMSGTVYQFDLKVGAYLQPGTQVALVGKIDQVKVVVYVDEPDLGRVGLHMPVTITSDSRPGRKWEGEVEKLPTEIKPLQTRRIGEVTTIIDNANHQLLPGVSVDAHIISQTVKDALIIPKAALRRVENADGVYKLEGRAIQWTTVKPGVSDVNNVQVLSGLNEGDQVADRVIDPPDAEIRNGMPVRPVFN